MNVPTNEEIVREIYSDFLTGNIEGVLNRLRYATCRGGVSSGITWWCLIEIVCASNRRLLVF